MGIQYKKLVHMKTTRWDAQKKYTIHYNYLKWFKTTVIVCIYAAFVICRIVIPQIKWGAEIGANMTFPYEGFSPNKVYTLAAQYNKEGWAYMESVDYDIAKTQFLLGLASNPDINTKDTLYNNLSLACYNLEEYDDALEYSKEALNIPDNDGVEYYG
jgi:tetratricopeptide (TPR) repeat protein